MSIFYAVCSGFLGGLALVAGEFFLFTKVNFIWFSVINILLFAGIIFGVWMLYSHFGNIALWGIGGGICAICLIAFIIYLILNGNDHLVQ